MTGEKEISVPYSDLVKMSITCKHCTAEVIVNIAESRQARIHSDKEQYVCPICRENFADRIGPALAHLSEWFRLIQESGHVATFRIKEPDD